MLYIILPGINSQKLCYFLSLLPFGISSQGITQERQLKWKCFWFWRKPPTGRRFSLSYRKNKYVWWISKLGQIVELFVKIRSFFKHQAPILRLKHIFLFIFRLGQIMGWYFSWIFLDQSQKFFISHDFDPMIDLVFQK